MEFQLSPTGKNCEKIIEAAIETGNEIPERLLNRPVLSAGTLFYWHAFLELNTCRGEGCIPWTAIDRYAVRYDVNEELFEDLVDVIGVLDDAFLEHRAKERDKK